MKNILRLFASGLVAAFLSLAAQAADLVPGAYSVGSLKGNVSYKLAGSSEYNPLTAGTALPQGVTIKTGADSAALIVFASGSTAAITAGSEIEITKFEQEVFTGPIPLDAEPSVSNTEIRVINGDIVNKVAKLKKGSSYTVNSPVGAAGVRGTIFKVSYNVLTGAYSVQVVEGGVILATVTGQSIPVGAGEQVVRGPEGNFDLSALPPEAARAIVTTIIGTLANTTVLQSIIGSGGITIEVDVNQVGVSPN